MTTQKKRSAADPPTRGSAPGYRWGHGSQTLVIRLRSALAICPQSQLLNPPLAIAMGQIIRLVLVYVTHITLLVDFLPDAPWAV